LRLGPGFSCHYALLKPGPGTRSGEQAYAQLVQRPAHRTAFILGLTDITTMPSIRSINLLTQTLALVQQLQLLLVAVLLQSV